MILKEFAPAKINLTLHVTGKRDDGYHNLKSLVTFANYGDEISFEAGGNDFTLTMSGAVIEGDNLILKAARAFKAAHPLCPFGAFHLVKNLPVASGLGGGSSDAAATLRLLNTDIHADLMPMAQKLGADVPICLDMKTRFMFGIGHDLGEVISGYSQHAILINPRIAISTQDIFKRLTLPVIETHNDRNDLEKPAVLFAPKIGELLQSLKALPHVQTARMSGSGATCFALFSNKNHASNAIVILQDSYPEYWIKQVLFGL